MSAVRVHWETRQYDQGVRSTRGLIPEHKPDVSSDFDTATEAIFRLAEFSMDMIGVASVDSVALEPRIVVRNAQFYKVDLCEYTGDIEPLRTFLGRWYDTRHPGISGGLLYSLCEGRGVQRGSFWAAAEHVLVSILKRTEDERREFIAHCVVFLDEVDPRYPRLDDRFNREKIVREFLALCETDPGEFNNYQAYLSLTEQAQ